MNIFKITPAWFYTEVKYPLRFLQIYVRGDALVILPFIILLLVIGFFSLKWTILLLALFLVFRFFGEMIYWLLQQFGDQKYRPYDYGFRNLDNNAVYILYQLSSLVCLVLSTGLVVFTLFFFR